MKIFVGMGPGHLTVLKISGAWIISSILELLEILLAITNFIINYITNFEILFLQLQGQKSDETDLMKQIRSLMRPDETNPQELESSCIAD